MAAPPECHCKLLETGRAQQVDRGSARAILYPGRRVRRQRVETEVGHPGATFSGDALPGCFWLMDGGRRPVRSVPRPIAPGPMRRTSRRSHPSAAGRDSSWKPRRVSASSPPAAVQVARGSARVVWLKDSEMFRCQGQPLGGRNSPRQVDKSVR